MGVDERDPYLPSDGSSSASSLTIPSQAQFSQLDEEKDLERAVTEKDRRSEPQNPAAKVVTALDWTGPDDPENPGNQDSTKRLRRLLYKHILTMPS